MKKVEGGVTAAEGFQAASTACLLYTSGSSTNRSESRSKIIREYCGRRVGRI